MVHEGMLKSASHMFATGFISPKQDCLVLRILRTPLLLFDSVRACEGQAPYFTYENDIDSVREEVIGD